MFDISWGELLIIGVVALIAIGPKELPTVLRTVGHWMAKVRRMAGEFQDQFREAMREAEMADLKKQVDDMTSTAGNFTNFDPIGTIRKEFEGAVGEPPKLEGQPVEAPVEPVPPSAPAEATVPEAPAPESAPADGRKTGDAA